MNQNNNQDNLIKLLQESQKNNRDQKIINACTIILTAIPTFILLWKSFRKTKPSSAVRLMRIETIMAKLALEKEAIKKEAAYEAERTKLETGLDSENSSPEKENKLDILSSLKKHGESLVKDKVNQFGKVAINKIDEIAEKIKSKKEE